MSRPGAGIWDVDGTLCDVTTIRHHVLGRHKNYDAFHYLSSYCPPIEWVADAARMAHGAGTAIIVVTARMERWRELTENWLDHNNIPWTELHMRKDGDTRPDHVVKEEILAELQERYTVIVAFDDRPSVVELWKSHGILTVQVSGWVDDEEEEAVTSQTQ